MRPIGRVAAAAADLVTAPRLAAAGALGSWIAGYGAYGAALDGEVELGAALAAVSLLLAGTAIAGAGLTQRELERARERGRREGAGE